MSSESPCSYIAGIDCKDHCVFLWCGNEESRGKEMFGSDVEDS